MSVAPGLLPVILCGGAGARLWPLSRLNAPKPFIRLADGSSLLQKTLRRAHMLAGDLPLWVMTHQALFFEVEQELALQAWQGGSRILLEPCGRNTAPACLIAALDAARLYGEDVTLLILPSDQLIENDAAFAAAVQKAMAFAAQGKLVTFGITPTSPATGYGYLKVSGDKVERFIEKPDIATAESMLKQGGYLWNAGIFCFRAGVLINEMKLHAPVLYNATTVAYNASLAASDAAALRIENTHFSKLENISIDYALMEKSQQVAVVPCDIGWSDVGSWRELSRYLAGSDVGDGNKIQGEAICQDAKDCFVHSENRAVGVVGVEGLIVVDTADAVLITSRQNNQGVRRVYEQLKERGHPSHKAHRTAQRPWGIYTVLEQGAGFKVKRIEINPGASISLQMHAHRSEHWVVVSGQAAVENDGTKTLLAAGQSTYVSVGSKHRVSNPGNEVLVIIEVQTGNYLEEDDIVRFEDNYGRKVQTS